MRAVGNVTRALADLQTDESIGLRGPFGRGWPLAAAEGRELLLVAGGIGLAPLRPVLYSALAAPARYARITVMLGARTPQDLLFTDELLRWKAEHGGWCKSSRDVARWTLSSKPPASPGTRSW